VAPAPARPPRRERVPCERPESARKLIERTGQGQATMSGRKPLSIPGPIREQVDRIVADFNQKIIKNPQCFYVPRYRGNDLYLDRHNYGSIGPIARLKYRGELTNWEFAIYPEYFIKPPTAPETALQSRIQGMTSRMDGLSIPR
jgi:hypothetical protein